MTNSPGLHVCTADHPTLALLFQCQQCEHFKDLSHLCTCLCCCLILRRGTIQGEVLIVHAIMIQLVSFLPVPCHSFTSPFCTQSQTVLPLQRSPNTILLHNWVSLTISRAWCTYVGDSCLPLCCHSKRLHGWYTLTHLMHFVIGFRTAHPYWFDSIHLHSKLGQVCDHGNRGSQNTNCWYRKSSAGRFKWPNFKISV